jgi:YbbR domain-containing protein
MALFRWIIRNLGIFILALILSLTVWISAVVTSDPNQDGKLQPVPLKINGQSEDLVLTNQVPTQVVISIKAPQSIWNQLNNNPNAVHAWIDLSGLDSGEHVVKVNVQIDANPVRVLSVEPEEVDVQLEKLVTTDMPVDLRVNGEPPLGFVKSTPVINPDQVTISGPESAVAKVQEVIASLDITGATQTVLSVVPVRAVDANGATVPGIDISPNEVQVTQPITILGGYKNVAVKVITTGQIAEGYRLTNISVTPPTVTIYSSDPQRIEELPGFVETMPVSLDGLTDDTEFNTSLNLPDGISLVSEPGVLVQIGVAAIEGSLTMTLPVETLGLSPELAANISPPNVEIIILGPLPVLKTLTPASFRVVVDLTNLVEGTYQIAPRLDLVPDTVQVEAIIPELVEVVIIIAPTPTPTRTPSPTPRPGTTPIVTPSPTRRP